MFSKVKNILVKHKKKFIVASVLIGGTAIALRYAQQKLIEFQESQAKLFLDKTKRLQHFESTEKTCNQAIVGLSTSLFEEILEILSTDKIVEQLKNNAENKIELWNELKMITFTRLTVLIYASSIFVIILRTQINLLGGYLYKDTRSEQKKITDELRQKYLSLIECFLKDGLKKLIKIIEEKVRLVMEMHQLNKKLKISDLESIFWSIQTSINNDFKEPNSKIIEYTFANIENDISDIPDLLKIYNETLDILESEDVEILCLNNISRGFSLAVDKIADFYDLPQKENCDTNSVLNTNNLTKTELNSVLNINSIDIPIAKLLPIINSLTSKNFNSIMKPHNLFTSLITYFMVSDKVKTFGANVYEVFST